VQNEAWMYGTEGTLETIVELINDVEVEGEVLPEERVCQ
jgi:hypothetical protein